MCSDSWKARELGPYKNTRKSQGNFKITPRTLSPKLGNCSIDFDPNEVYGTIYSSLVLQGDGLKNTDIAKNILFYVAGVLGKKLNMAIFSGKRSDSGDTTAELFDGFDTITEAEKTATNISDEKGNYIALKTITEANAIEEFQKLFDACDDELKGTALQNFLHACRLPSLLPQLPVAAWFIALQSRVQKDIFGGFG